MSDQGDQWLPREGCSNSSGTCYRDGEPVEVRDANLDASPETREVHKSLLRRESASVRPGVSKPRC